MAEFTEEVFSEEVPAEDELVEEVLVEEELEADASAPVVLEDGVLPSDRVADLVEYLVCALVEKDEAISLDVTDSDEGTLIEISCDPDDAGRVIGRKGRTIKAIRTLARALGSRVGTAVEVEVLG